MIKVVSIDYKDKDHKYLKTFDLDKDCIYEHIEQEGDGDIDK